MTDEKKQKRRRLKLDITVHADDKEDLADKLHDIADTISKNIDDKDIPIKREH